MKNYKVAIIGGAGFIGSRLSAFLDKQEVQYDICDIDLKKN